MAVSPNRFPNMEQKIISKKRLLFLAVLKGPVIPLDCLDPTVFHLGSDVWEFQSRANVSRLNWAEETNRAFTACLVTLHRVYSQRNEFCVVLCLPHSSFSSNLMSSLFCVPFVFVFFHPFILFACSLLLLLPVFMHGTWWEELEPPSCHSSRLQFDWNMIIIAFITAPDNTLHQLSIRLHISRHTAEAPELNQDLCCSPLLFVATRSRPECFWQF